MTPSELARLRDEVLTDPKNLGYADHLPDSPGIVVDLLTKVHTDSLLGPLRSTTAKMWAATGPYARIYDASLQLDHPCRASCLVIRESFACGDPIHVEDVRLQALLTAWINAGIATQAEVDALYGLADTPATRADMLGFNKIEVGDLIDAGVTQ
jgi:hypothetical protein